MTIQDKILEPFYVRVEEGQYVLVEKKTTQKGEEHEEIKGYFINPAVLILRATQIKIARSDDTVSLEGYVRRFQDMQKAISEALVGI